VVEDVKVTEANAAGAIRRSNSLVKSLAALNILFVCIKRRLNFRLGFNQNQVSSLTLRQSKTPDFQVRLP
jgi:hypothetical protein